VGGDGSARVNDPVAGYNKKRDNAMKIGDIVKQRGVMVRGKSVSDQLGVIVDIQDRDNENSSEIYASAWAKKVFGRHISVLWANGKLMERIAETALQVVT